MRFTVLLVLFGAIVALLSSSQTTLKKLKIFVEAFISIADETLFVLICTYCVVPLLVYSMHTLFLREEGPENERHIRQLESAHHKQIKREQHAQSLREGTAAATTSTINDSDFSYGFFANTSFTIIGVLIIIRIIKELFGVDISSFLNFASTLSVGIGFAFNDTINNLISGVVTQLNLGIRHGDEVKASDNTTWFVNEVGTLGITISQRQNTAIIDSNIAKATKQHDNKGAPGAISAAKEAAATVAAVEAGERAHENGSHDIIYIQRFVGHTTFTNSFARISGPHRI